MPARPHEDWVLIYGSWFVVYGLWFMVCGLWFMVYGVWFRVYGLVLTGEQVPSPQIIDNLLLLYYSQA